MKYLIDTSAYSAFGRGDSRLDTVFAAESEIYIPCIVAGELRAGFSVGAHHKQNEALLKRFLAMPNVTMLMISDETITHYAAIYAQLRQNGRPIGSNDMWIAALALEHNLQLVTLDSDFHCIKELRIVQIAK